MSAGVETEIDRETPMTETATIMCPGCGRQQAVPAACVRAKDPIKCLGCGKSARADLWGGMFRAPPRSARRGDGWLARQTLTDWGNLFAGLLLIDGLISLAAPIAGIGGVLFFLAAVICYVGGRIEVAIRETREQKEL